MESVAVGAIAMAVLVGFVATVVFGLSIMGAMGWGLFAGAPVGALLGMGRRR